jgi:hypothetical protein
MSTRARRLLGALSLLALLVLVAAAVATAEDGTPIVKGQATQRSGANMADGGKVRKVGQTQPAPSAPKAHAVNTQAYRLTATLAGTDTTASGHWMGWLVHTNGMLTSGVVRTAPACSVNGPPNRPVKPQHPAQPSRASGPRIACRPFPSAPLPASGNHWTLFWKLTYNALSGPSTGTDIRVSAPGAAPSAAGALLATICSPCVSGKFARMEVDADQAQALIDNRGFVVVRTAAKPDGEISGAITRATQLLNTK